MRPSPDLYLEGLLLLDGFTPPTITKKTALLKGIYPDGGSCPIKLKSQFRKMVEDRTALQIKSRDADHGAGLTRLSPQGSIRPRKLNSSALLLMKEIKPSDDFAKRMSEALEGLAPLIQSASIKISESIVKFVDDHGGPEKFQEALLKITENAARLIAALPAIEKRRKEAEKSVYEGLPDYSWFFDPAMDAEEFFALAELINAKDENAINQTMVEHFRARLDAIEGELNAEHEKRARILSEAFKAHREKRYALAIPVFLAQTDGISRELIGVEYFTLSTKRKPVEALIKEVAGSFFLESALRALLPTGAIREPNPKKRKGRFNRHAVMHGVDLGYASELNGLKAVSLLNFMNRMNDLKQKRPLSKAS